MSTVIETTALKNALNQIMFACRKSSISILEMVLIRVDRNIVTLTASDLDNQATVSVDAGGTDGWSICVNGKLLLSAVKSGRDTVELSLDGDTLLLDTHSLPTLPAADFPLESIVADRTARLTLDCDTFRAIARKVGFASSTEKTRYYLNGIFVHCASGTMRAVATDGHRLAVMPVRCDRDGTWTDSILPRTLIAGLTKALGKKGNPLMEIDQIPARRKIIIRTGRLSVVANLIDGTFPGYQRVIPARSVATVTYDRLDLKSALARVNLTEDTPGVTLDCRHGETLLSNCAADGAGSVTVAACTMVGTTNKRIGFNHKHLSQIVNVVGGTTVTLALTDDSTDPVTITGDDDPGYLIVLMPMHV